MDSWQKPLTLDSAFDRTRVDDPLSCGATSCTTGPALVHILDKITNIAESQKRIEACLTCLAGRQVDVDESLAPVVRGTRRSVGVCQFEQEESVGHSFEHQDDQSRKLSRFRSNSWPRDPKLREGFTVGVLNRSRSTFALSRSRLSPWKA